MKEKIETLLDEATILYNEEEYKKALELFNKLLEIRELEDSLITEITPKRDYCNKKCIEKNVENKLCTAEEVQAGQLFDYKTLPNGTLEITGFKKLQDTNIVAFEKNLLIPNKIYDIPVTSIGIGAFTKQDIVEVVVEEGILSVGYSSFLNCNKLEEVKLPDGLIFIGGSAFAKCENLSEINIPDSVTSVSDSAFDGCNNLPDIELPDQTFSLAKNTFKNYSSILKKGASAITENQFKNLKKLRNAKNQQTEDLDDGTNANDDKNPDSDN